MGCCSSQVSEGSKPVPAAREAAVTEAVSPESLYVEIGQADGRAQTEAISFDANVTQDLSNYFVKLYKGGGVFEHDDYKHDPQDWCWIHKTSGIKVWQDALDLTGGCGSGEVQCFFHYTSELGFRNITAPQKKAVEVFASLVTEGPKANAWWGQGVYSVRKAPHQWPSVHSIVDNNFRNMYKRDAEKNGKEAADKEYQSRVGFCIPIFADASIAYDVSVQQTPEMAEKAKPPGQNLADKLLNEPGLPQRECIVIRVQREEEVRSASAVLLNSLELRAAAVAQRMGAEDPYALLALSRLGNVLEDRGLFPRAEEVNRRLLRGYEAKFGPEDPGKTLAAVNSLALVLDQQGKLEEAEGLYRRALAGCERQLGLEDLKTLLSLHNLATNLMRQKKLDEAEELERRALKGLQKVLGESHPHTLSSINTLAIILERQNKLPQAERLYQQTLERKETALGREHPSTLVLVHNLAVFLKRQGRLPEAEDLLWRAVRGRELQLGPDHPSTLDSVGFLAELLEEKGELEEAEGLLRRVVAAREAQLGATDPKTLDAVFGLAKLLEKKGALEEAEDLFVRALHGMEVG